MNNEEEMYNDEMTYDEFDNYLTHCDMVFDEIKDELMLQKDKDNYNKEIDERLNQELGINQIMCLKCNENFITDTPKHFFESGVVEALCHNCVCEMMEKELTSSQEDLILDRDEKYIEAMIDDIKEEKSEVVDVV